MIFKLIGTMLLVTATSYVGMNMSRSLKKRVCKLELIRRMVSEMSTLIRYRALTVSEILSELISSPVYSDLVFLQKANTEQTSIQPFQIIWENAVNKDSSLHDEEKSELISLGCNLGSSDIEGQISSLSLYKDKFNSIIVKAEIDYNNKGKLYRTLGVLSGAFAAVLLI